MPKLLGPLRCIYPTLGTPTCSWCLGIELPIVVLRCPPYLVSGGEVGLHVSSLNPDTETL